MNKILEIKDITKKYKSITAVDKVNLTVNKGDIYGLVGKNGAGKTTLFKLIMGLIPQDSGEIIFESSDSKKKISLARRKLSFMIGSSFFPYLSAHENIEYYRRLKGIPNSDETKRVLKMLKLDNVKKPFKHFSMGMKQRLGLASALLGSPDIIILDEPVNGLDPEGITEIRRIIKKMNKEHGITFVISSHILSELELTATKFGFIDHGKLLMEISSEDLYQNTQKSLVLQVNDVQKAIILLETQLNAKNYKINRFNEIELHDFIEAPDKISELLMKNGVRLYKLEKKGMTLENYYMELIGGEQNA